MQSGSPKLTLSFAKCLPAFRSIALSPLLLGAKLFRVGANTLVKASKPLGNLKFRPSILASVADPWERSFKERNWSDSYGHSPWESES